MANHDRAERVRELDAQAQERYRSRARQRIEKDSEERIKYRQSLAHANRAVVYERQIGKSDLLRVNYLERGLMVSRAVCHIDIRGRHGDSVGTATGFLVGPRLLLTNAHVLLDEDEAQNSIAAFNYEDDVFSLPKQQVLFSLKGEELFVRDEELDFALCAIARTDIRGTRSTEEFGFLRLRENSGKAQKGENVTIIQHPDGRSKEIAVRANEVVDVFDHFIHYEADTDKGSSGSPVFSDEWEVVALHHAGVRADEEGNILNRSGDPWSERNDEHEISWKANEGIRIHSIINHLQEVYNDLDPRDEDDARKRTLLHPLTLEVADPASGPYVGRRGDISVERRNTAWYQAAEGYTVDFLGPDAGVPFPNFAQHANVASEELQYRHFSIVMNVSRRQALFTACNIDGGLLVPSDDTIGWKLDPRLDAGSQIENEFYKDQSGRTNFLDRGHLVRRLDPAWGDIAAEAIDDTFHWTNSALQHRSFNNGIWGRLEDALMARVAGTIMTVFTGPVLQPNDPVLTVTRPDGTTDQARVPLAFWKVIAFADDEGWFTTAGFRQSQANLVQGMNLDFEIDVQDLLTHQVPIQQIQQEVGLTFGDLSDFEAQEAQLEFEADRRAGGRRVRGPDDLLLVGQRRGERRTRRHPEYDRRVNQDAAQTKPARSTKRKGKPGKSKS